MYTVATISSPADINQLVIQCGYSGIRFAILLDELQEQVLRQVRYFVNFYHLVNLQPEPGRTCRHDDAILGQKTTSVIDQRGALHDQSVTRSVQSLQILLFDAIQRHAPHGWPVGSLENGYGIKRIIIRSLHECLDETRMDEENGITHLLEGEAPVV